MTDSGRETVAGPGSGRQWRTETGSDKAVAGIVRAIGSDIQDSDRQWQIVGIQWYTVAGNDRQWQDNGKSWQGSGRQRQAVTGQWQGSDMQW